MSQQELSAQLTELLDRADVLTDTDRDAYEILFRQIRALQAAGVKPITRAPNYRQETDEGTDEGVADEALDEENN